jgi:5'-nucleotidase
MFQLPTDLSRAKILVTNDDGVHADGIGVLEKIARTLSDNVWVVAPETEQSCKSHSLTLDRPLNIKQISERKFHVNGTPSDTVLLAINHIFKDAKPDLVLSGINFGRNAGVDVTYSGTVAAAMEATMLGVPAIALSQKIVDGYASWNVAEKHAADVIRKLVGMGGWPENTLMNVNFPHEKTGGVRGIKIASHIGGKTRDDVLEREGLWGVPYYWVGHSVYEEYGEDTDVAALKAGYISVTPIKLDFTDYDFMAKMKTII